MHIDWKHLAQSPGYRSLKQAYKDDLHRNAKWDSPHEVERKRQMFKRIIGLAQNHAIRRNTSVGIVLNGWEKRRDYNWYNFYNKINKLPSGKPRNVQHQKVSTWLRNEQFYSEERKFQRGRQIRQSEAEIARKKRGKKPRWSANKKTWRQSIKGM